MIFDNAMRSLEIEVMEDVIRRIRINSEITRSADELRTNLENEIAEIKKRDEKYAKLFNDD